MAVGIETPLDHDAETVDREEFWDRPQSAARQELEARIRPFIGIAGGLALLDDGDQSVELRIFLGNLDAAPLQRIDEVRLAALVRYHDPAEIAGARSEEHTSELQSLMRISYAVFCLKKKTKLDMLLQTAFSSCPSMRHTSII